MPLILLFLLTGCASNRAPPSEPLNPAQCKIGEFRGVGIGTNEKEALSEAKADLAKQIHSSVRVSEKYRQSQNVQNGKESLGSDFVSETLVEANLLNAQDAHVLSVEQKRGKTNAIVCMAKADAAKGFTERQRLIADSLELVSHVLQNTEHPKRKNEAWHKTQMLWNEFTRIQNLLDGWDIEKASFYDLANETYSQTREDYKGYCQTSKLHWKSEQENDYSSIAFSMLSKNLKMEKSACKSNGISLVYKHAEPDCSRKFGVYNCFYKPSLSILSCDGAEYSLLENTAENSHQKQELALEKMKDALKSVDFWGKWEREIKEWRPKCE
jgi:hypothetical protein